MERCAACLGWPRAGSLRAPREVLHLRKKSDIANHVVSFVLYVSCVLTIHYDVIVLLATQPTTISHGIVSRGLPYHTTQNVQSHPLTSPILHLALYRAVPYVASCHMSSRYTILSFLVSGDSYHAMPGLAAVSAYKAMHPSQGSSDMMGPLVWSAYIYIYIYIYMCAYSCSIPPDPIYIYNHIYVYIYIYIYMA